MITHIYIMKKGVKTMSNNDTLVSLWGDRTPSQQIGKNSKDIYDLQQMAFRPVGVWNANTQYYVNDIVSYDGSSYLSLTDNVGVEPKNNSNWQLWAGAGTGTNLVVSAHYETVDELPDPTQTPVGIVVSVGTAIPYDIYIMSAVNGFDEWVNYGPLNGPQGSVGPKGDTGATGPQGAQGDVGPAGAQGIQGPQGSVGPQGPAGATGPTGQQGITGPQGPIGPQGPVGAQGPIGETGLTGAFMGEWQSGVTYNLGNTVVILDTSVTPNLLRQFTSLENNNTDNPLSGSTKWYLSGGQGPIGPIGPQGGIGPQGIQGPQGEQGPAGPQGPQGAVGPIGPTGPAGAQGPQGLQGVAGPTGPTGPKGDTGATGGQGPQGIQGPQGLQGPAGVSAYARTSGGCSFRCTSAMSVSGNYVTSLIGTTFAKSTFSVASGAYYDLAINSGMYAVDFRYTFDVYDNQGGTRVKVGSTCTWAMVINGGYNGTFVIHNGTT